MKPLIKRFEAFTSLGRQNDKARFDQFCEECFASIVHQQEPSPETPSTSSHQQEQDRTAPEYEHDDGDPVTLAPDTTTSVSPSTPKTTEPVNIRSPASDTSTPSRVRGLKLTPVKRQMKARYQFSSNSWSKDRKKYKKRIKDLRSKLDVQKLTQIKYLNQDIKRKSVSMKSKDAEIALLKAEIRKLKKEKPNSSKQENHMQQEQNLEQTLKNLKSNHKRLKKSNKQKRLKNNTCKWSPKSNT